MQVTNLLDLCAKIGLQIMIILLINLIWQYFVRLIA